MRHFYALTLLLCTALAGCGFGRTGPDTATLQEVHYIRALHSYERWILPNSQALEPGTDIDQTQAKRERTLHEYTARLDNPGGRQMLGRREQHSSDEMELAFIRWARDWLDAN